MDIQEHAKKISEYLIDKVRKYGTFKNHFIETYSHIGEVNGMSPNECRLCCEYLESIGCIQIVKSADTNDDEWEIKANPSIVDFLKNFTS